MWDVLPKQGQAGWSLAVTHLFIILLYCEKWKSTVSCNQRGVNEILLKMVIKFPWKKKETRWFSWKGLLLNCSPMCHISTSGHISFLLFSSQGLCSCSEKEDTPIHARDDNPASLPPFHSDNCWLWQEQHRKELPLLYIIFFNISRK